MPEFAPGEVKTAIAPITVQPSGLSCEAEVFLGPDELTKIATSGRIPFVSTGVSQDVPLPLTIPVTEGTYHVYVDVYAEGYLVAAYQAIEDVVVGISAGDFVYSNEFFELRSYRELVPGAGTASCYVVFRCTITNQGNERGTRTIEFYYQRYSTYYNRMGTPYLVKTFQLTLEPGESYQFVLDEVVVLAHGTSIWYVFLKDSAGGESQHLSAT